MKLFSFGVSAIGLLFVINTNGQNYSKEQLKLVEQEAITIKTDNVLYTISDLKTENNFDLAAIKVFQSADSLLTFVSQKKQDKTTVFNDTISLQIEVKCHELALKTIDLNDEEEQVFDSFLSVFKWEKAVETVKLYENFILQHYKEQENAETILTVLSFVKHVYFYIESKKKIQSELTIYQCIAENFEANNHVDWKVFALHPGKLIFWTIAACAWDVKSEK